MQRWLPIIILLVFSAMIPLKLDAQDSVGKITNELFTIPEISGFPKDTFMVKIKLLTMYDDRYYELEVKLQKEKPDGKLTLVEAELDPLETLKKGMMVPSKTPPMDPFTSVRTCLAAIQKKDPATFKKFLSQKDVEKLDKDPKEFDEIEEKNAKRTAEAGYDQFKIIIDHLPKIEPLPARIFAIAVEYEFLAEVKDRKGSFNIELELMIDRPNPANWVIDDLDVDFHEKDPWKEPSDKMNESLPME